MGRHPRCWIVGLSRLRHPWLTSGILSELVGHIIPARMTRRFRHSTGMSNRTGSDALLLSRLCSVCSTCVPVSYFHKKRSYLCSLGGGDLLGSRPPDVCSVQHFYSTDNMSDDVFADLELSFVPETKRPALRLYLRRLIREGRTQIRGKLDVGCESLQQQRSHSAAELLEVIDWKLRGRRELKQLLNGLQAEERNLVPLALEEKTKLEQEIHAIERELLTVLIPREPHDHGQAFLEVLAGITTAGDICQQFAGEVFQMYEGYAKHMGWTFEILDFAPANIGGLRHASARVSGHEAFRRLKFEGGTHRVQRIPQTGLSSRMQRIHTGTATVVVLPQPAEIDIKLNLRDLRIDTFRASGAGGQHVNCTESAIRITHLPTGTVMECQEERSQLQNRQRALQKLQQCLFRIRYEAEAKSRQSSRKLQVGTRAQAERIRTYNFNQNRVTDHRILHTVHGIQSFVSGGRTLHDTIDLLLEASDWEALIDLQERNLGTRTAGSPSLED